MCHVAAWRSARCAAARRGMACGGVARGVWWHGTVRGMRQGVAWRAVTRRVVSCRGVVHGGAWRGVAWSAAVWCSAVHGVRPPNVGRHGVGRWAVFGWSTCRVASWHGVQPRADGLGTCKKRKKGRGSDLPELVLVRRGLKEVGEGGVACREPRSAAWRLPESPVCNALAGIKARRWRLGSQSGVGRVMCGWQRRGGRAPYSVVLLLLVLLGG